MKLELKVNKVVDIIYNNEIYKTSIQDIRDGEMLIIIPTRDGEYLTLNKDDEIEQLYYDDKNVFSYKSKVIARVKEGLIPFYKISKPYNIKRIQRRNYVRISTFKDINYIKESKDINNSEDKLLDAFLLDLSGGGMKMKTNEELDVNDTIISNLIFDEDEVKVKGKVVRVDKSNDKKYICGIRFEDIDNITREKIIRIVFKIMRKEISMI